jgi:hypothetical protein
MDESYPKFVEKMGETMEKLESYPVQTSFKELHIKFSGL